MALPELRGTARLLADPNTGTGKNGAPWTSVLVKFQTWHKTDTGWDEGEGTIATVAAYGDVVSLLNRHARGDEIRIHGTVKATVWDGKPQLAITASVIAEAEKATRPAKATPVIKPGVAGLAAARQAASSTLRQYMDRTA